MSVVNERERLTETTVQTHVKLKHAVRYSGVSRNNNGFVSTFRVSTVIYLKL